MCVHVPGGGGGVGSGGERERNNEWECCSMNRNMESQDNFKKRKTSSFDDE